MDLDLDTFLTALYVIVDDLTNAISTPIRDDASAAEAW
jgi:hypothetical protein